MTAYCGGIENTAYDSPVFLHHRNTFERDAVRDAIHKYYTGIRELSLDEYCLYGGLFQGTLLGYEAEHIRVQPSCSGSLLWCFNDGFGEVGFSMMDRFCNPKPVYYYLKRAYAPRRLILKRGDGGIDIYLTNSSVDAFETTLTYGYVSLDGNTVKTESMDVTVAAYSGAVRVATFSDEGLDLSNGIVFASGDGLCTATLFDREFRLLSVPKRAELTVSDVVKENDKLSFTVKSDVYAHGVHFGLHGSVLLSDCYFDLLPGESRRITVYDADIVAEDIRPVCVFVG